MKVDYKHSYKLHMKHCKSAFTNMMMV